MSILEQYNLKVYKTVGPISEAKELTINTTVPGSDSSALSFLSSLDERECRTFLYDMNVCLEDQNNGGGGLLR